MSHQNNVNVLDTASELITRLNGSKMGLEIERAVASNDLERVYELNQAIIAGMAKAILEEGE